MKTLTVTTDALDVLGLALSGLPVAGVVAIAAIVAAWAAASFLVRHI